MTGAVGRVDNAVGNDQALPVHVAARARRGAQDAARDGIEHAHAAPVQVEQHIVGDDRRRAAGAVAPLRGERGIAAAVDVEPQRGCTIAVDDEYPSAAVGRIDPGRGLRQYRVSLRNRKRRADRAGEMARTSQTAQIGEVEQPQHPVLAALQSQVLHVGSRRHRENRRTSAADVGITVVE